MINNKSYLKNIYIGVDINNIIIYLGSNLQSKNCE